MIITDQTILKQKSKKFAGTNVELKNLISLLEKELYDSKIHGVGLSAIQINKPIQVAIIRTKDLKLNLFNAKITEANKPIIFTKEGCLSIPSTFMDTLRYEAIKIKNGDGLIYELKKYEAVVVQHELDHTAGILFTDRAI